MPPSPRSSLWKIHLAHLDMYVHKGQRRVLICPDRGQGHGLQHGVFSVSTWCLETKLTLFSIVFRNKSWNKRVCAWTGYLHHTDNPQVRHSGLSFAPGMCFEYLDQWGGSVGWSLITTGTHAVLSLPWLKSKAPHSVKLLTFPRGLIAALRCFPSNSWSVSLEAGAGVTVGFHWNIPGLCVGGLSGSAAGWFLTGISIPGWVISSASQPPCNRASIKQQLLLSLQAGLLFPFCCSNVELSLPPVLLQFLIMMGLFGFYFGLF